MMKGKARWLCCTIAILGLVTTGSQAALVIDDMEDVSGWTPTNLTRDVSTLHKAGTYSQKLIFTTGGTGSTTARETRKSFGVDLSAYNKIGFWWYASKPHHAMFQVRNQDGPGIWSYLTVFFGTDTGVPQNEWAWVEFDISAVDRNWVDNIVFVFQDDWSPNNSYPDTAYELYIDDLTAIPEPGTMALLGMGAASLLIRRRRARA